MLINKPILIFLISFFLAGANYLSGQQTNNYQVNQCKLVGSSASSNSANFQLLKSNLGEMCFGQSQSSNYILNGRSGFVSVEDSKMLSILLPKKFSLLQNYPNPFNPITTIPYSIAKETEVTIKIFNALGQQIKTIHRGKQQQGNYLLEWDATNNEGSKVPSGIYYYQIIAEGFNGVRKMLFLK